MQSDSLNGNLPVELVTFDALKKSISIVGVNSMAITVCPYSEGGYVLISVPRAKARKRLVMKSEKSGELRNFKTIDAAVKVCRQLGFSSVEVVL